MVETGVWPIGSLEAVESPILRMRAAEDSSSERIPGDRPEVSVTISAAGKIWKRGWAIVKRTFLRSSMTVLAYSLATRGQKYLV